MLFRYGEEPNDNKVQVSVNCCWQQSRRSFKQVHEQCTQDGKKPTHLEALRGLRAKLEGHAAPVSESGLMAARHGSGEREEQRDEREHERERSLISHKDHDRLQYKLVLLSTVVPVQLFCTGTSGSKDAVRITVRSRVKVV